MKIIVLGGDGFCGWPTSLKLASDGHDVIIVDNMSRRAIDMEINGNSLTDIKSIHDRVRVANKLIGDIRFRYINIAEDYASLVDLIDKEKPDSIVHFAEQRTAPYSMMGAPQRRYTIDNNINGTHNVLSAIVDCDPTIHLVHLGTMGVYGYSKAMGAIPEGYLNVRVNETQEDVDILYPTQPGSIYHMTKSLDQIMFQFYNKNWGLRITDLHQGIVWGTQTPETRLDPTLVNRFDYDAIYGTVLNRFISQAAADIPLTVYGTGGQTRAFIHIRDTARCVQLAVENPTDDTSKVRIFNQVAETRNLLELATIIRDQYGAEVSFVENPRKELAKNELEVHNEGLVSLGFEPITLSVELVEDVIFIADECKHKLKKENVLNSPKW